MMAESTMVIVMTSIAALGALAMLIAAIRTSYAIEKRSDGTVLWRGLPRYTNMFRTAFGGKSVAQDEETRELIGKMRKQLLFMAAFIALMILTVILNR
ncbi:MAG: hypothetical protein KDJ62_05115 [Rhodobiaceae bacterium]|nr:hypothetical protein [Rhodobiaceae bacterium]MCC0048458.1 hypothetical protein [Rhodobiaceae bacterium]